MANYLLAITPHEIQDQDYPSAFVRMMGCNAAYDGVSWNGTVSFLKVQVGSLWSSLVKMNEESVLDNGSLTVVWSVDPFDHLKDRDRQQYQLHFKEIIGIVRRWAEDLGSEPGGGLYFDGDVCWILEGTDTLGLSADFSGVKRSRFTLINGAKGAD
ncbi:hypothetical protein [Pseudomonas syringae]|uniref:hypothetical protein n=1 Tax=Pseudomonas syringae TaxID=317 RepID=UPI000CD35B38|nr:hypothetical protein [Pseudomonas syringae]MCF5197130.1 hypothetical protein [Pseudomonas syringae]MCF5208397.1 hypothetical protein [Pseudomonas syringae]MCF5212638.1 hypothetical protein [Pseudomonas syringae]MCF5221319.1 hypothetical protein [Pseudomonas syringae]MCF5263594.1 hypothetical protein [Pseudomonas syringae]